MTYTKETIEAEAKRRYPPGTIFNSTGGNRGVEILSHTKFEYIGSLLYIRDFKFSEQYAEAKVYNGTLEGDGIWAEIIKLGEIKSEIINVYEIY